MLEREDNENEGINLCRGQRHRASTPVKETEFSQPVEQVHGVR